MRNRALATLGLLALAGFLLVGPGSASTLTMVHWDSQPTAGGYLEVFEVRSHPAGLRAQDVAFRVDGAAVNATWDAASAGGGELRDGARAGLDVPAHDGCRVLLVLRTPGNQVLAELHFGSGAGTPAQDAGVQGCDVGAIGDEPTDEASGNTAAMDMPTSGTSSAPGTV